MIRKILLVGLALVVINAWAHVGTSGVGPLVEMAVGWVVMGYLLFAAWPRIKSDLHALSSRTWLPRIGRGSRGGEVL